jgi:hypothetical protein
MNPNRAGVNITIPGADRGPCGVIQAPGMVRYKHPKYIPHQYVDQQFRPPGLDGRQGIIKAPDEGFQPQGQKYLFCWSQPAASKDDTVNHVGVENRR